MAANEQTIIDALNDCVDRIASGASIEDCLRLYPTFANLLRPMLETVQAAKRSNYPPADMLGALERGRLRVQAALEEPMGGAGGAPRRLGGLGSFLLLILLLLAALGGGAVLLAPRLLQPQQTVVSAPTQPVLPDLVLATNTFAPTETPIATVSASETPLPTTTVTHTAASQTGEAAMIESDDEAPTTTSTATATASATASATATASTTATASATASATAEVTATSTQRTTVMPSATTSAPEAASPTATPMTTIIVIEGPVQRINANEITIYTFTILVDVDDPILSVINLDDMLRVEGRLDAADGTIRSAVVVIQNPLVVINPETGEAWRDPGNCTNPPPAWAPADSWRQRCEGSSGGTSSGGGQSSGSGGADSGSTSGGSSAPPPGGSGGGGAPPPDDDDDGGDGDD